MGLQDPPNKRACKLSWVNIQIKIAVDLVHILIKILVESHMAFNWEIKSTFDSTHTDRPALKVKVALPQP